jgi:hypothetical protein
MATKRHMSDRERREKRTLQRNIERAVALRIGARDADAAAAASYLRSLGMVNGNVQRIMDDTTSMQLITIADLAGKLGVSVADLFRPDAEESDLSPPPATWPLRRLSPKQWEDLEDYERGAVEEAMVMKARELRAEAPRGDLSRKPLKSGTE